MTASPASAACSRIAVMVTAFLGAGVLLGAQAEGKVSPLETAPAAFAPSPPSTSLDGLPRRTAQGDTAVRVIRADPLDAVSADSAGVLDAEDGGLGVGMWWGTDRSVVDVMLPRLPTATPSPVLRSLSNRLLLTAAAAPDGAAPSGTLAAERVRLLRVMGESIALRDLMDAMPRDVDPTVWRFAAEDRLLANDPPAACAIASVQIDRSEDSFWPKLLAFCQVLAGETKKASLGVRLLQETDEADPAFFALFSALLGEAATVDETLEPQPLHVAMARAANFVWPADVAVGNDLGVLRAFAVDPNLPPARRLDAAERSHAAGALEANTLRQIYVEGESTVVLTPAGEGTDVEAAAPAGEGTDAVATEGLDGLYRRALAEPESGERVATVATALAEARKQGIYFSTARLFLPLVDAVAPQAIMPTEARELVRAALVVGNVEQARAWYYAVVKQVENDGNASAEARAAVLDMTLLLRLALVLDGEVDFIQWWSLIGDEDNARTRAARYLMLFAALGEPVPSDHWEKLLDGPSRVDGGPIAHPVIRHRLGEAAEAGRIGETVLLATVALGDDGPATTDLDALAAAVAALHGIGLEDEARALAIEAVALDS